MLRALLVLGSAVLASMPTLLADTLRQTLDPSRGHRIDPQKVLVIEAGCYLGAILLFAVALALPWLLERLERAAASVERRSAGRNLRRRPDASVLERVLCVLFLLVVASLTANLVLDRTSGLALAAEDGVIETATALLYLLAAVATFTLASRCARVPFTRWSLGGLGALYFVVGMEEMSWGQRALGIETPETLARLNVQGELTLHNLWSTSINQALALAVTFVLLVALPLLRRWWPTARKLIDGLGLPVAPATAPALYAAAIVAVVIIGLELGTLGIGPRSLYGLQPHFDDEYLEFFLGLLFFVVSITGYRLEAGRLPERATVPPSDDLAADRLTS